MALGSDDYGARYRRRRARNTVRTVIYICLLIITGMLSYDAGMDAAEQPVVELRREIDRVETEKRDLMRTMGDLSIEVEKARSQTRLLEAQYKREIPDTLTRQLVGALREKLSEGVTAERLAFVMRETNNKRACDDKPATKRFMVSTPLYKGPAGAVTFFDNAVTVTGTGDSARDSTGNPEAWFDPAKPIAVEFVHVEGGDGKATGALPLHHSLVVNDTEYRFSITQGPQGFVYIAGDRCKFP
jgi:hypothetical protein